MNKKIFVDCIAFLQGSFGAISEERFKSLNFALQGFSDDQLKAATKEILMTFRPTSSNPFPVPADFMAAIGADAKTKAEKAFCKIVKAISTVGAYRSVDFGDSEIHSTISRFGGWVMLCTWTQEDWNINEGRFKAALESAYQCKTNETITHVCGIFERTNGMLRKCDIIALAETKRPFLDYTQPQKIENKKASNGFMKISEMVEAA